MMVAECLGGHAVFNVNFRKVTLEKGGLMFLFNDMLTLPESESDDFEIRYLSLDKGRSQDMFYTVNSAKFWNIVYSNPVIRTDSASRAIVDRLLDVCEMVVRDTGRAASESMLTSIASALLMKFQDMADNGQLSEDDGGSLSPAWKQVSDFFIMVNRHYMRHHSVSYYAERLSITSDYLNRLVRSVTGQNAKSCITETLIIAIKGMLKNTSLPIKMISDRLGFAESSYMCRVFRKATGLSPAEYRSRFM